jgi:phosphoribosylamine-glycine ligase
MKKIAIFGFTPREEVIVDKLRKQNSAINIALYSGIPNIALEKRVDSVHGLLESDFKNLLTYKPDIVLIGPDKFSSNGLKEKIEKLGIAVIGANQEQIKIETDKSYLREAFPELNKYYPPNSILSEYNKGHISDLLDSYETYVVKYNGTYYQLGGGTKISGIHLKNRDEALDYIKNSIQECGKVVIEKKIEGVDFSVNAITAADGSVFFFPENYCYKLRNDDNLGPNTSGTGSFAFADKLPFLSQKSKDKAREITNDIISKINSKSNCPLVSGLNVDFRVSSDDQVYLFEVNARFAGAGTLSTVLDICENNLFDLFTKSLSGTFSNESFKKNNECSLGIFAFPKFFPQEPINSSLVAIPKASSLPKRINCYTGWIDVQSETDDRYIAYLKNSTSLLVQTSSINMKACQKELYNILNQLPEELEYRSDVGDLDKPFLALTEI